jgi:hypothetical protein
LTKAETANLIALIVMAYPSFDKFRDEKHIKLLTDTWAGMFIDDSGGLVEMAVKKHISVSKWPPSIAEIREIMAGITKPDIIPPDEAWAAVANVMYSVGEFRHDDLSQYLPPLVLQAVEAVGYSALYEQYRHHTGYDRVAFKDVYEPMYQREREKAMLPLSLQKKFDLASRKFTEGGRAKLTASAEAKQQRKNLLRQLFTAKYEEPENEQKMIEGSDEDNFLPSGTE